jgi:hypothetical protein
MGSSASPTPRCARCSRGSANDAGRPTALRRHLERRELDQLIAPLAHGLQGLDGGVRGRHAAGVCTAAASVDQSWYRADERLPRFLQAMELSHSVITPSFHPRGNEENYGRQAVKPSSGAKTYPHALEKSLNDSFAAYTCKNHSALVIDVDEEVCVIVVKVTPMAQAIVV